MSDTPEHKPYVAPEQNLRELTVRAVVMGAVLGLVFAASSVYLGLKVGLTVSASIPIAVLSITLFRWFGMRGTILENNIAQTTGSAGESLAAGVAFTLPSLLIMGFEVELIRILLVSLLGGLIGVLMMIPLRHGLIVKEHGKLAYPEGTACADVLVAGEKGGTDAARVFLGFGVGIVYGFLNIVMKLWHEVATFTTSFGGHLKKASIGFEVSPPMLGVGYIIGPRVAANMIAGGLLAFVVLIPLIAMLDPAAKDLSPSGIRGAYVLYIGAGAVAAGGFIALARSIPTIISAFRRGMGNLKAAEPGARVVGNQSVLRTERDLPMTIVLGGSAILAVAIFAAPTLDIDFLTALLVVVFGFFFVTVSSRIVGIIGTSSNPISGMTIATLLLTCGLFVLIGRTGVGFKAMALSTAALVCVAASNGGTISQDLKTGYLVGATPRLQQISIAVGVVTSAIVIGFVLLTLLDSRTRFEPVDHPGVTMTATAKTETGPDKRPYQVAWERDERTDTAGKTVVRGKYLVDGAGAPIFFVRSSVDPNYPYKLAEKNVQLPPSIRLDAEAAVDTARANASVGRLGAPMLGIDRKSYRVLELSEEVGPLGKGRYYVSEAGLVTYQALPAEFFDAPKAQLFALIIDGILGGNLKWGLVLIGIFIAIILELVGVAALPFAVGLYLPIATSGAIFIGASVRWLVDRKRKGEDAHAAEFSPGMLMASGLIAGGALAGIVLTSDTIEKGLNFSHLTSFASDWTWFPMVPFLAMALGLWYVGTRRDKPPLPTAEVVDKK
jgi:putative OPT family oligopeptide transporter